MFFLKITTLHPWSSNLSLLWARYIYELYYTKKAWNRKMETMRSSSCQSQTGVWFVSLDWLRDKSMKIFGQKYKMSTENAQWQVEMLRSMWSMWSMWHLPDTLTEPIYANLTLEAISKELYDWLLQEKYGDPKQQTHSELNDSVTVWFLVSFYRVFIEAFTGKLGLYLSYPAKISCGFPEQLRHLRMQPWLPSGRNLALSTSLGIAQPPGETLKGFQLPNANSAFSSSWMRDKFMDDQKSR